MSLAEFDECFLAEEERILGQFTRWSLTMSTRGGESGAPGPGLDTRPVTNLPLMGIENKHLPSI